MSAVTTSANERVPERSCRPVPGALTDHRLRQVRQVCGVLIGRVSTELAVDPGSCEELVEHVGVHVGGSALREDAVLMPVALENRLDDQFPRVARHRLLERRERRGDDGLDLVGLLQQFVDGSVGRLGGYDPDLKENVLFTRKVEVEQRLRDTRRRADVGNGRGGVALGAPQRHRRLHEAALRLMRSCPLEGGPALTTVSLVDHGGIRHAQHINKPSAPWK